MSADPFTDELPRFPAPRTRSCPFDPAPALRAVQAEAPIARVEIWDGSTPWLVSGYEEVRTLLRDPRLSAGPEHPNYPHSTPSKFMQRLSFLTMDAPEHTRQRRFVAKPFSAKRIEAMRPPIQELVDDLVDRLLAGPKPADLLEAFALPVPCTVICHLLGVPYDDHGFFAMSAKALINPRATHEEAMAARQGLVDYIDRLLTVKRTEPGEDLLSELANEHVATGNLTQEDATLIGMLMLLGGFDTTANTISLGVLALTENRDQFAVLLEMETPAEIEGAVEEILRYTAVPQGGRRRVALADIEINGLVIRAGDGLILAGDLANRDASAVEEPDRLDLRRPPHRHVTFGHGPHQCLGMPLARLELQVAFPTLLRRIPTLRRAVDMDQIEFREPGMGVYGVNDLPVTW
ncbi:cytochrome P450 [Amycolatopsis sp. H20-H5]|uniref:cytochrome P450 n=1 Tax=Amycolatopsis sp. H20-H5 TaxID=3046309 RepID=UPI002DBD6309|nr:cytochrome P450 [Amycolatopsis sp. H20-H5]MEC3974360.1 cytochrome P450 [Amycolatopsis sp. H20-H5]